MRIGILGAGGMAGALGAQWVRAGHEVVLGGRDPGRTRVAVDRIEAETSAPARARQEARPGARPDTATRAEARVRAGARAEDDAWTGAQAESETRAGVRSEDQARAVAQAEGETRAVAQAGVRGEVRAGTLSEAAGFGEVVLLAVPHEGVPDVLREVGGALRGRTLVDCVNAVLPGFRLAGGAAFAERVAALVPGTPVVKAFNLCHVDVWRLTPPVFGGRALVVPLCGDDPAALETVRGLVRDIGCTPADGGGLDRAGLLEATAAFAIGLWTNGVEAQAMLPPLAYSPPAT